MNHTFIGYWTLRPSCITTVQKWLEQGKTGP